MTVFPSGNGATTPRYVPPGVRTDQDYALPPGQGISLPAPSWYENPVVIVALIVAAISLLRKR